MNVEFTDEALTQLESQISYLRDKYSVAAAKKLQHRIETFLTDSLSMFPRTGRWIDGRDVWEIWIPKTRIVIWYALTDDTLSIVAVWHSSQDRSEKA